VASKKALAIAAAVAPITSSPAPVEGSSRQVWPEMFNPEEKVSAIVRRIKEIRGTTGQPWNAWPWNA
jgi:hypothetical protein